MTIRELLKLGLGESVRVLNKPFTHVGHAKIDWDGDGSMRWLYDDENGLLAISPEDEEILLFQEIETEMEPDGDTITYQEKEYEFMSEDTALVSETEGESVAEPDDRYLITDYRSPEGEIIRLVNNENTGESLMYVGKYVSEDDIVEF
jgi:hypothetical protein